MFRKKAQPKDSYEQPEIHEEESDERISAWREAGFDVDTTTLDAINIGLHRGDRPKANPSIISKVWK